jgi:hypothetical protein
MGTRLFAPRPRPPGEVQTFSTLIPEVSLDRTVTRAVPLAHVIVRGMGIFARIVGELCLIHCHWIYTMYANQ